MASSRYRYLQVVPTNTLGQYYRNLPVRSTNFRRWACLLAALSSCFQFNLFDTPTRFVKSLDVPTISKQPFVDWKNLVYYYFPKHRKAKFIIFIHSWFMRTSISIIHDNTKINSFRWFYWMENKVSWNILRWCVDYVKTLPLFAQNTLSDATACIPGKCISECVLCYYKLVYLWSKLNNKALHKNIIYDQVEPSFKANIL